ncbi:MAG: hypothetical protein ACKOQM_00530 [Novosphingobium sp.]
MGSKIPAETTLRALDAVAFLNGEHGYAFNGMLTVNFEQLGLNKESEVKYAVRRLNEGISKLIARHTERWRYPATHTYLYVHEDVATSHGHHLHELVKIPRGLAPELPAWLYRWASRNFGEVPKAAVHYKGQYHSDLEKQAENQGRLVRYVLKSSDDACVRSPSHEPTTLHHVLDVARHPRAYCAKVKRVVGVSQNISELEQLKAGFWRVEYPELALGDHYLKEHRRRLNADELNEVLARMWDD